MLTTPVIGKYIDGRRGSIIGLAIGVTILTWIIALVALRQVTKPPETPEQPKTSSDDMREKQSATYTTIGELLAVWGKEIDIVSGWAEIVEKKSEVAQFSIHFPAAGSIERLHSQLKEIEQLRDTSSLMHEWTIDE